MPDFRQLHDQDIHALYAELANQYEIPELNRDDPSIKYGLRNADGTGVLAGVSSIGSVQGYYMEDGVRMPMPGRRACHCYSHQPDMERESAHDQTPHGGRPEQQGCSCKH